MKVVVATHGHCFDGLASAVVFTRLLGAIGGPKRKCVYRACGYGNGQTRADATLLCGDENAILDYRYSAVGNVTWFFDHHRTAFQTSDDQGVFEEKKAGGRYFYDPDYSSCTKLIADVAWRHFALNDPALADLVHWADIVDSARFDSPEHAISRTEPIMRMVSVVEHYGDDGFLERMVPELLKKPLAEVARSQLIEDRYKPLGEKQGRFVERVREKGQRMGRVVFVDLTETVLDSVGKFVTYALFPDSVYSVVVGVLKSGAKVSVGYNPWSGKPLDTDISAICARYGGGGHPVVGAIAFRAAEVDRAREIARAIAEELA
ncbi:MAG: hypothetical protein IPI67_12690 [Myxococcales bacterium]|nr:hypothetical protein [Myxococcales bacterium]